ncbi:MAG: hypothetical protein HY815_12160 [Candidatus Riflebacteria bacterium]|nr:hypothetical protein [Candidatus Riflebacteria bacterium]
MDFLKGESQSSRDYLIDLLKSHEIVIVCEQDHRESTQYDLLHDVVTHGDFVQRVGHVFIEVGSDSQERRFDDFLTAGRLEPRVVEGCLLDIYRNLIWGSL